MNDKEEEALHRLHGVREPLLHRIHPQVMEKILRVHLTLLGAIILVGLEGSILPRSALEKLHQSSEREARMLPSLPMTGPTETPIGFWHLYNNLMPPSVDRIFKKPPSYAILQCT